MIQGGGMDKNMKESATREPIKNEANNGLKMINIQLQWRVQCNLTQQLLNSLLMLKIMIFKFQR